MFRVKVNNHKTSSFQCFMSVINTMAHKHMRIKLMGDFSYQKSTPMPWLCSCALSLRHWDIQIGRINYPAKCGSIRVFRLPVLSTVWNWIWLGTKKICVFCAISWMLHKYAFVNHFGTGLNGSICCMYDGCEISPCLLHVLFISESTQRAF